MMKFRKMNHEKKSSLNIIETKQSVESTEKVEEVEMD